MKKTLFIIFGIIQLIVALGAIPAGYSLMTVPDGSGLGMSVKLLAGSPFRDFFVPGLVLFVVNGWFNLINAALCFFRSWMALKIGLCLGIGLFIWVSVQVYSIGLNSFLQPAFFLIGIAEVILSLSLLKNSQQFSPSFL